MNHVKNKFERRNLLFLGHKQKAFVAAILRSARVLIAPYEKKVDDNAGNDITKYMSPLKLFEYMASERPFIISRSEFSKEIVTEDVHCLMAEAENIEEWVQKIELLHNTQDLSENLARNAFRLYNEFYTWEKRASIVLDQI